MINLTKITKKCEYCNKIIINITGNNQKYHPECSRLKFNEYLKKYFKKRKENLEFYIKNKIYQQEWKKRNNYNAIYYQKNRDKSLRKSKKWAEKNIEKLKEYKKKWAFNNKKRIKDYKKDWAIKNKEQIKKRLKEYHSKDEVKKMVCKKYLDKIKSDKNFAILTRLRVLLLNALKRYTKEGKINPSKKYGIDYNIIIEHLKPFPENIKDYHIDHIKPLCLFNFVNEDSSTNLEEVRKAFAPENLQWLLAIENRRKGGRYNEH